MTIDTRRAIRHEKARTAASGLDHRAQIEAAKKNLIAAAAELLDVLPSQNDAAKALGVQQPIISRLVREDPTGFTFERLLRYVTALGLDVSIEIAIKPARGRKGLVTVVDGTPTD